MSFFGYILKYEFSLHTLSFVEVNCTFVSTVWSVFHVLVVFWAVDMHCTIIFSHVNFEIYQSRNVPLCYYLCSVYKSSCCCCENVAVPLSVPWKG